MRRKKPTGPTPEELKKAKEEINKARNTLGRLSATANMAQVMQQVTSTTGLQFGSAHSATSSRPLDFSHSHRASIVNLEVRQSDDTPLKLTVTMSVAGHDGEWHELMTHIDLLQGFATTFYDGKPMPAEDRFWEEQVEKLRDRILSEGENG